MFVSLRSIIKKWQNRRYQNVMHEWGYCYQLLNLFIVFVPFRFPPRAINWCMSRFKQLCIFNQFSLLENESSIVFSMAQRDYGGEGIVIGLYEKTRQFQIERTLKSTLNLKRHPFSNQKLSPAMTFPFGHPIGKKSNPYPTPTQAFIVVHFALYNMTSECLSKVAIMIEKQLLPTTLKKCRTTSRERKERNLDRLLANLKAIFLQSIQDSFSKFRRQGISRALSC